MSTSIARIGYAGNYMSNQVTYEFGRLLVLLCCLLRDQPAE